MTTSAPTPRVGLVLGAGGAMAAAYHAGVLAALEHDLGWDARDAEVIVGTSAGSLVAAVLRRGVAPSDLSSVVHGGRSLHSDPAIVERLRDRPELPSPGLTRLLGAWRAPTPALVGGLGTAIATRRIDAAPFLMMFLPSGRERLESHLEFLDRPAEPAWPDGLLVCAARARDGRRRVLHRDNSGSLARAVAASCAVPGYFRPVVEDGVALVDGGVVSPTNADVLRRHDLDVAIVVSALTGDDGTRRFANRARRYLRHGLEREVRSLRRAGVETIVVEPGPDVLRHMTFDFTADEESADVAREAFFDAGRQVAGRREQFDALRGTTRPVAV